MAAQPPTVNSQAIKAAGGSLLEHGVGLRIGGWKIQIKKGAITADTDLDAIKARLGVFALPEQYYGSNCLSLTHEASNSTLSFSALGAFAERARDSAPLARVHMASEWLAAHAEEVQAHSAKVLEYDWTFTTGYRGTFEVEAGETLPSTRKPERGAALPSRRDATPPPLEAILAREGEHWRPCDETVDRDLLTARDPILLYDELRLYDSELEDNGLASLTVKVRVMPRCWYVLMRFFVRVDGVLVRVRDVRLFCRFDGRDVADRVVRETTHFERPLAGQPNASRAFKDADASAAALQASAPDHVTLYLVERLNLS